MASTRSFNTLRVCPACKSGMLTKRRGKHGPFYGCNKFPECDYTEDIVKDDNPRVIKEDVSEMAVKRFNLAVEFIRACGGVYAAGEALKSASTIMESIADADPGQLPAPQDLRDDPNPF